MSICFRKCSFKSWKMQLQSHYFLKTLCIYKFIIPQHFLLMVLFLNSNPFYDFLNLMFQYLLPTFCLLFSIGSIYKQNMIRVLLFFQSSNTIFMTISPYFPQRFTFSKFFMAFHVILHSFFLFGSVKHIWNNFYFQICFHFFPFFLNLSVSFFLSPLSLSLSLSLNLFVLFF